MPRRALFLLFFVASSALAQGPSADWRTVRTPHFRVHYPAQYEAWARRAASDLESIRAAVVQEVGDDPQQVTDILVMNPIADSNGATIPLLDHPRIVLFTEPPDPESQIGEFHHWIDLLTVHEMTHLIHLLRPPRNVMERLLTYILPLNPITLKAPRWVLEGYATVVEGKLTGSGRPNGSYRAAILRKWAIAGQLPSYSQLNSDRRFLGMSMAYLVGSAYLEWLEQRSGPDSLRHLWARLTARQRRSFNEAFVGVFGDSPDRLYGDFTAELTERAMAVAGQERPSLREGDLWQETRRGSGDPAVSPDGKELAMVLRNEKRESKLVVFSTGPNPEEKKYEERIARMLRSDPQDVAPVRTKPLSRKPLFTLIPPDGGDINWPRWTRDGKSILFTHKQPDREGFLHHDLFLWTPAAHETRRVTHLADVEDADPLPDGTSAVAVRNRNGLSQLIIVNISSGEVTQYAEPSLDKIAAHPRASSDGRIAWAEHDATGWHLDGVPALAGQDRLKPVLQSSFEPEWGPHGELFASVAANGFIEIARLDNGLHEVTRSFGAALDPAPAPDGSIFFMSLEPEGFELRHLADVSDSLAELALNPHLAPAVPPIPPTPAAFRAEPLPPSRPYGIGRQEFAAEVGGSWTAYGASEEIGVRLGDVVGRLDTLAMLSSGSRSADRGAALISAWRGWPVDVTAHLFTLTRQKGVELRGQYEVHAPLHLLQIEAGGMAGTSSRAFLDGAFTLRQRQSSERVRAAIDSANRARVSASAAAKIFGIRVAGLAEAARKMSLGGVASSITPDGILLERVDDPALPLGFAEARRYRGIRGEVSWGGVTAFWQRHDLGGRRLDVRGLEASMASPPVPLIDLPALRLTAGVARASRIRGTKGWLALRLQP